MTQLESPLLTLVAKFATLSPCSPHIQHAIIRARRADSELAKVIHDGVEAIDAAWIRLRGRLEELEDAILSVPPFVGRAALVAEVRSTRDKLSDIVILATKQAEEGGRRGETWADDSPRRRKIRPPPNGELHLAAGVQGSPSPAQSVPAAHAHKFDLAYTSYLLATDPAQVLPPGKTLSVALHSRDHPVPPPLPIVDVTSTPEGRTRRELRDGRLSPFVSALSPALPAPEQTQGWNSLVTAVWDACRNLVPDRIKGIEAKRPLSLRFTPSPSPFDLNAATAGLHALAFLLSTLCAPARDDLAQPLLVSLSAPVVPSKVTPALPTPSPSQTLTPAQLVQAVQDVLRLADEMTKDMETFQRTVGSAVDDELLVRMAAWENERSAVLSAYGGRAQGSFAGSKPAKAPGEGSRELEREEDEAALGNVTKSVVRWLEARSTGPANSLRSTWLDPATTDVARGELLTSALLDSIFDDKPISFERQVRMRLHLASNSNFLPAILVIPSPNIFRLQQFVQGIVVVGCLASLARVPLPIAPAQPDPLGDEWAQRLWAILKPDMDSLSPSSLEPPSLASSAAREPVDDTVKLADLAEEILRVRRIGRGQRPAVGVGAGGGNDEASSVRASVNRVIRTEDPVYRLLAGRAKDALRIALLRPPTCRSIGVPSSMATGIAANARALGGSGNATKRKGTVEPLTVKGFARQPLMGRKMAELVEEIRGVLEWSAEVWGESLRFAIAA